MAGPGLAQARQAAPPEAAATLEEVIVTAQKRSERLTDVPASIASVGADQIAATGAQRVSEVGNYVPNVTISGDDALGASVSIRGVGAGSRNIGFDSRVGVYLDGVYLGQSPAVDQELLGIERVEVLRGPQGALFGKNTVAGALNLITSRPSETFSGQAVVRLGNLDLRQAQARITGPLTDGVTAALSVGKIERDGFIKNVLDGHTLASRDTLSYRAQLQIDRIENLQIYATVDGLRGRERANLGNPLTDTFATQLDTITPATDAVSLNHSTPDKRDIFGSSVELTYNLPGDLSLKSITSYRDTRFHTVRDVDGSPLDFLYVDYADRYKQTTQEFQLISPKGGKLEYLLGLYYYHQDGTSHRDALGGTLGSALGVAPGKGTTTGGEVDTDSFAAFGNATYQLAARLKLGLGFRLSHEEKTVDYAIDGSGAPAFNLATGTFQGKMKNDDFSPTVTLTYAIDPSSNAYLRYAEGYKSGGFNLDFISADIFPGGIAFDKETVRNYEAGLKTTFWERRVQMNLAVFRADYDNYQLNRYVDLGGGRTVITLSNVGAVRSQGLELEGTARPMAGLTLRGGVGLLDTYFTNFPDGGPAGQNLKGNKVPGAARFQGSFGVDYAHDLSGDLVGKAGLQYSYRSGVYSDVGNATSTVVAGQTIPFDRVKGGGLVDARLAVGPQSGRWEASLWARNLTDRDRVGSYGREFLGTLFEYRNEPRTYGVALSTSF